MESGLYEICHSDEPRVQVLLLRDTFFPSCRNCGEAVRYRLVQAAPHISEDPDFMDAPTEDNPLTTQTVLNISFPVQLGRPHGFRFWHHIVQAWRSGSERGIYRVLHKGHRDTHEVSLNADEIFPACRECGTHVRFDLLLRLPPQGESGAA